ncbi:hypothetical protein M427DRAFT_324932 [Gonapodya prolifera JEL478]|uniref:Uncharacterized protein n=1 Tax=Gonapodya prolifera (strain JEL478) TaxID=1344416 RepID=A0A139AF23_GONPJ|nr:hypothetical protein M427DRAFT_324932 [Gonapodya prolifera JEL478]|eukprot:KXS15422.1 hypothetical protein M427DRAFT_324932 [Gonapodya prolifera JEL478]
MSSLSDGLFPTSVALFHPDEFERYALLRERVATIERGALAVERAIRGFFPDTPDPSSRASGDTKGEDNSLSDRVKHTFREDIVQSYNQWKPIIWDQEFAARELKSATDKVQEAEEYFSATLRALEDNDEMAVKYRTIKGTSVEDDSFPRATRSSHPEAFERYLRHKQRLREVEVGATMVEQVTKVLAEKRKAFAVAAAAVDEASKSECWEGYPYGLPVVQAGSSIAPSRRASTKSGGSSTAANSKVAVSNQSPSTPSLGGTMVSTPALSFRSSTPQPTSSAPHPSLSRRSFTPTPFFRTQHQDNFGPMSPISPVQQRSSSPAEAFFNSARDGIPFLRGRAATDTFLTPTSPSPTSRRDSLPLHRSAQRSDYSSDGLLPERPSTPSTPTPSTQRPKYKWLKSIKRAPSWFKTAPEVQAALEQSNRASIAS